MQKPKHHTPKGFRNYYRNEESSLWDVVKWKTGIKNTEKPLFTEKEAPFTLEKVAPTLEIIHSPPIGKIVLTWIGHSSFLLQLNGVNILIDPVFTKNITPVTKSRLLPPGLLPSQLPVIDVVLLSHNHYDHLNLKSLKQLHEYVKYLIPLRVGRQFSFFGKRDYHELDWWQHFNFKGLEFHFVPSCHYSSRYGYDKKQTLWGGWVIKSGGKKVYCTGDTAYSPIFSDIFNEFGGMDLSLIPIGAYRPRWFMKGSHVNPPEAVRIHKEVQSKKSIAMHWGTFKLSDEPLGEPPLFLQLAKREMQVPDDEFITLNIGETVVV